MSKLLENAIKIAHENRANAMIAAKRAADQGVIDRVKAYLGDPANKGKSTAIEAGLGGFAAGGLGYGLTKALGGSNGWAWANAGMAGGGTAAGIAGLKYRKEIGNALKGIVRGKRIPGTPEGAELDDVVSMTQQNAAAQAGEEDNIKKSIDILKKYGDQNNPAVAGTIKTLQARLNGSLTPEDTDQAGLNAVVQEYKNKGRDIEQAKRLSRQNAALKEQERNYPRIGSLNTQRDANGKVIDRPHDNSQGGKNDPSDIQKLRALAASGDSAAIQAMKALGL